MRVGTPLTFWKPASLDAWINGILNDWAMVEVLLCLKLFSLSKVKVKSSNAIIPKKKEHDVLQNFWPLGGFELLTYKFKHIHICYLFKKRQTVGVVLGLLDVG